MKMFLLLSESQGHRVNKNERIMVILWIRWYMEHLVRSIKNGKIVSG